MNILDLLHDVMGIIVGQSILTHQFLDETQLLGTLVVDHCVLLLITQDLLQVSLCTQSIMIALLRLHLSSFATAAGKDGLLSRLRTLTFETDRL